MDNHEKFYRNKIKHDLGLPYLEVENYEFEEKDLKCLSKNFCKEHNVIPIELLESKSISKKILTICMGKPTEELYDKLQKHTGCLIRIFKGCPDKIDDLINKLYNKRKENQIMKKVVMTLAFVFFLSGSALAVQPPGFGSVLDNNSGSQGDILIHSGDARGNSDVGTWVDSSFLKGEKGDKGDKGDQGDQGDTGATGSSGQDGSDGENGQDGAKGDQGDKGQEGKQGIRGPEGKGLEDRYELIVEGRLWDKRKHAGFIYAGRDFNNDVNIIGAKVQYKFGKSYEETRLDELEAKLDAVLDLQTAEEQANLDYANENYNIEVLPSGGAIITGKF